MPDENEAACLREFVQIRDHGICRSRVRGDGPAIARGRASGAGYRYQSAGWRQESWLPHRELVLCARIREVEAQIAIVNRYAGRDRHERNRVAV